MKFESEFDKVYNNIILEDTEDEKDLESAGNDPNENDDTPEEDPKGKWDKKTVDAFINDVIKESNHFKEVLKNAHEFVGKSNLAGEKIPAALWSGRIVPAITNADIKGKNNLFDVKENCRIKSTKSGKALLKIFGFENPKDLIGASEEGTVSGRNKKMVKISTEEVDNFLKTAKIVNSAMNALKKDSDTFEMDIKSLRTTFEEAFEKAFSGKTLNETLFNALFEIDGDSNFGWGDNKDKFKEFLKNSKVTISMHAQDDEGAGQYLERKAKKLFNFFSESVEDKKED